MPTIRVKITDSNQPMSWFASAWDDGRGPEATIKALNRKAKVVSHIGKVTYELATETDYWAYRDELKGTTK